MLAKLVFPVRGLLGLGEDRQRDTLGGDLVSTGLQDVVVACRGLRSSQNPETTFSCQ